MEKYLFEALGNLHMKPTYIKSFFKCLFLTILLHPGIVYGTSSGISPDTTKIPEALRITRDGKSPATPLKTEYLLSDLAIDTVKQVFQAPPCISGDYYVAFQLFYDLGDRQTQQNWLADLEITLMYNLDSLWTKPLSLVMENQVFIATVFHDSLVTCSDSYTFKIHNKQLQNGAPEDYIYLNVLLYKHEGAVFNPADPLTLSYSYLNEEINTSWSYTGPGVESFDVEWVFIDARDTLFIGTTAQEAFNWKEPVRISTAAQYFDQISYYPTGKLWYRARAVGINPAYPDHRIAGHWYYGSGNAINITNHQANITWQQQTVFSENGKYKKVMNYYDGTSRQRQVLTNLSSQELTLVGENLYDYEGRPAGTILPVPGANNSLQYKANFNTFQPLDPDVTTHVSADLKKFNYDNHREVNSIVSTTTGAGKYYSSNNNLQQLHKDFLPDAGGYVFAQTEYLRDGTGRISRQSGVGETFKMDGSHVVRYYYGEAAPYDLVRLFGSNVGNASHYKKNMVVDANGQVSVSYLDQEDRTIATALAGGPTTNLDTLPSFKAMDTTSITVDVSQKNIKANGISRLQHKILNATPNTQYSFEYKLTALGAELDTFGCQECVFDLRISITDPDGIALNLSNATGNESSDSLLYEIFNRSGANCINPDSIADIQFSVLLADIGDYTITKTVTPQDLSFSQMKTLVAQNDSIAHLVQQISESYEVDSTDCVICDETCPEAEAVINEAIEEIAEKDCENIYLQIEQFYRDRDGQASIELYEVPLDSIESHPDYCAYLLCVQNQASDVFEKQIARIADWDAAVLGGYDQLLTLDPFFTNQDLSGHSHQAAMQARLDNIHIADIPYDNNNDGVQDGVTPYGGTISQITDPANTSFYINDQGLNDVNGYHMLYLDLMRRQSDMTVQEYNKQLSFQRWVLFRNFYLEAKRKTKLEIPAYQNCPKAMDELGAVDELPQKEQDVKQWAQENGLSDSVSNETVEMMVANIGGSCDTTFSYTDSVAIANYLKAYFDSDSDNFFNLIFKTDLGSDSNLIGIQNILNGYSCGLDSVALDDPVVCLNDTIIYLPADILYPSPPLSSRSNNIDGDLTKEQKIRARKEGRSNARFDESNFEYEQFSIMQDSLEAKMIEEIIQRLAVRRNKKKSTSQSVPGVKTLSTMATPPLQRDALIAIYNATGGASWVNNTNWLSINPVSTWFGVTTDVSGNVTELDLNNNNLSGSLPAEIGDLSSLESLNLTTNSLSGIIPTTIGNLSNLEYLHLIRNPLSGIIPTTIGNLTNLIDLRIQQTQLSGSIPNEIGNLSSLEILYLTSNPLSGTIPTIIGNLTNLKILHIGHSQLSGSIPNEIGNLSSLESLNLIDNVLADTIPSSLGNLSILKIMDLSRNSLDGDIPVEIGNLSNLVSLYLTNNTLSGSIPVEIGNLTNLVSLFLTDNSFTGSLPSEIGQLSNLVGLGISVNNLTGSIPPEIGQLNQLEFLDLGNNDLTGQIPIELDSLLNLRTLMLSFNDLTGSISSGIGLLPNLTRLDLRQNNLSGTIPDNLGNGNGFNNNNGYIYLNNNELEGTVPSSLGKPLIQTLYLNSNNLSGDIPIELIVLKNMNQNFQINDNAFTFQNFLNIIQGFDGTSQVNYVVQDSIDTEKTVSTYNGGPLTLKSNIDRNTVPPCKYQWFKYVDGVADIALNTLSENGHTVTLNNIFESDEGTQYYYKITNPDGPLLTLTSRFQTLDVGPGNEVNLCLQFDTTNVTLQQFMFTVDLDQLVQECLEKAADEDSILVNYATEKFYEKVITSFYNDYRTNCLEGVNDSLRYTYKSQEYHYTLYYYDQAGNLAQTVPPEGVKPLSTEATTAFLGGTLSQPVHELVTRYQYNSLNQLIEQKTPDAGQSQFWYDGIARLRLSQNAQQLIDTAYSYTKYDEQGRIIEVGEMHTETLLSQLLDSLDSKTFPLALHYTLTDVTRTHYDFPKPGLTAFDQQNLRTRVSWVEIMNYEATDTVITCYSYDIHGNVTSLLQQLPGFEPKRTDYVYDLISGNVNNVLYQYGEEDQFIHRYEYDADNRLTEVYTSADGFIWDKDAAYTYYLHGPLARVELGEYRVQGMDYYYTLQGWLKGVNQAYEDDPDISNLADFMAGKDVFAFNLGYFNGDYSPINALLTPTEQRDQLWQRYTEMNGDNGLYNGNIAFMNTDLAKIGHENNDRTKGMQAMLYRYDQLNRIIRARSLTDYQAGTGFQTRPATPAAYDTDYSYDANGNLLTLQRFDETGILQDDFTYSYFNGTNRLRQYLPIDQNKTYNGAVTSNDILYHNITVTGNSFVPTGKDVVLRATGSITISPTFTTSDGNSFNARIEPDSIGMYQYDAIGNLIRDQQEGVHISWTPYGKVREVRSRLDSLVVSFTYDAAGNRIEKKVVNQGTELTTMVTRYLRDASGNVMAIYQDSVMTEQPIYGSSRLGMYKGGKIAAHRNMGTKRYELNNHLGNVMTVITDSIGMKLDSVWATVASTSDYYPFGLGMEGRSFSDSTYRYGFQGQEKDKETGYVNYKYRMHDPRIGRFFAIDPLTEGYPWNSPYSFSENSVIAFVELEGLEKYYAADGSRVGQVGENTEIRIIKDKHLTYTKNLFENFNIETSNMLRSFLLNNASINTHENLDDLAAKFSLTYGAESIVLEKEYSARIGSVQIQDEGMSKELYILGSLVNDGTDNSSDIDKSNIYGTKLAAGVHTHGRHPDQIKNPGTRADNFSGGPQIDNFLGREGDIDWVNKYNTRLYLANPRGELRVYLPQKYEPGAEKGQLLYSTLIFDPRGPTPQKFRKRPAFDLNVLYEYQAKGWQVYPRKKDIIKYGGKGIKYEGIIDDN